MTGPVWIEAALNGPWARTHQPKIPITADEIYSEAVACAEAGAAIIHFHAYDPDTGRQRDDFEIYAPIIERIRSRIDVICYPTIPFAGSVDAPAPMPAERRFEAVEKLMRAGLVEWAVVDPGSTNITQYADVPEGREGFTYANPEAHVRFGLELASKYRTHPSFAIYEPGFMRLGAALCATQPEVPEPIYRFMFSDQLTFGFPPKEWALDAYLELLRQEAPGAFWMIAGLGVEIEPLIEASVARGGHVRVGLEDARFRCEQPNIALVKGAVQKLYRLGRRAATVNEVRSALSRA
jgi:3-keto-5-aminohexanoate cleavage enzyme